MFSGVSGARHTHLVMAIIVPIAALAILLGGPILGLPANDIVIATAGTPANSNVDIAYVTLYNANQVALVDTTTQAVLGSIDLVPAGCFAPWRASMSPDGAEVYISCYVSDNVAVINTTSLTVTGTIGGIPDADGIAFTRDATHALVGSRWSHQIAVVDIASHLISFLPTPAEPRSIVAHPFLDIAYATSADGNLLVVDTTAFSIVDSIAVGQEPWDVAVSYDGQWVFVSDRWDGTLTVIDASTHAVHATVTGLGELNGMDVAPDGSAIFVGGLYGEIHVIDGTLFSLLDTVTVNGTTWEMAVTCDGQQLLAGSAHYYELAVIDTATYGVSYVSLPNSSPRGLVICPQYVETGLVLLPAVQSDAGAPATTVTYTETALNLTGQTDLFYFVAEGNEWPVSLTANGNPVSHTGVITDGASFVFNVQVDVPSEAAWYTTDSFTLTARSLLSPTGYVDEVVITTEAYAPPRISVAPDALSSTQAVGEIVTQSFSISNGHGVTLTYEVEPRTGEIGVAFAAVSTELYGYDVPGGGTTLVGTEDDTQVFLIDLTTGAVIDEIGDLDRYETESISVPDYTYYKVESDAPVAALQRAYCCYSLFAPSLEEGPVGTEFILSYQRPAYGDFYVFAIEEADIEVFDATGALVSSLSLAEGSFAYLLQNAHAPADGPRPVTESLKRLPLAEDSPTHSSHGPTVENEGLDAYHVRSTGRIALEAVGENGYTTVPSSDGQGVGHRFYFGTHYYSSGAMLVFAYEDAEVAVYELATDELAYSASLSAGAHWWQTGMGKNAWRLESTGAVEVWAGATEGYANVIEELGDDISFAGGVDGREYYLHTLMEGVVIFAPFHNTTVDVDGTVYQLDKDEVLHLPECCLFRHVVASRPVLIQTLGRDSYWNDVGSYLGGVVTRQTAPSWLTVTEASGWVPPNATVTVTVVYSATTLQPGAYTGELGINSDDPDTPRLSVPLTLTVQPTPNMGWVEGVVSDAATGHPLEATVTADGQPFVVTSDAQSGSYLLWLDAGTYTARVAATGYVTATAEIAITAQAGTTQDFSLVPDVPRLAHTPSSLSATLDYGESAQQTLTITNEGPAELSFALAPYHGQAVAAQGPNASGGPDAFGYSFQDSNEPGGPAFAWIDISESGTAITSWTSTDDGYAGPIPLGFSFDYYGTAYTELYVGSNGYISFGQGYGTIPWGTLPQTNDPNNDVALFGDDMYVASPGTDTRVFYETLQNPTRFVLMLENLYYCCWAGTPHTMELILYENGNILVQYLELEGTTTSYAGIENASGTIGLSYGATLSDNLAICYAYPGNAPDCLPAGVSWLTTDPITGTIPGYGELPVTITFDAGSAQPGSHAAHLRVDSNDPITPTTRVDATMDVLPTDDMGTVSGALSDAWTELPLAATVELMNVHTAQADPDYLIWAHEGGYTLSAYAQGYFTATRTVEVEAGGTTVVDVALEPAQPRLGFTLESITGSLVAGTSEVVTFTVANEGPLPLDIAVYEAYPDLAPQAPLDPRLDGAVILFDQAHSGASASNYDTLITDLATAGAQILLNLTFPLPASLLESVDVLWVSEGWANDWTFAELTLVSQWLAEGGAVLVLGGESEATEPLAGIYNIAYECCDFYYGFTDNITPHLITVGVSQIYLDYFNHHLAGAPLSEVAVSYENGEAHVIAHEEDGGRMVVVSGEDFGDGVINQADNRLLANNVMAWLASPAYGDIPWLSVTPDEVAIPGHGSQTFVVAMDAENLVPGEVEAYLALEHNDPALPPVVSTHLTLTVVAPQAGVALVPVDQEGSGAPGEDMVYEISLTNAGNITDTFTLDLLSTWPAILAPDGPVLLGPGQSVSLTLTVTIPANADDGAVDTSIITATSMLDPETLASAQVTTLAVREAWLLYLPSLMRLTD